MLSGEAKARLRELAEREVAENAPPPTAGQLAAIAAVLGPVLAGDAPGRPAARAVTRCMIEPRP